MFTSLDHFFQKPFFIYRSTPETRYVDKSTAKSTSYALERADKFTQNLSTVKKASEIKRENLKNTVKESIPRRAAVTATESYVVSPEMARRGTGVLSILKADSNLQAIFSNKKLLMLAYSNMMKQNEGNWDINLIKEGDVISVIDGDLTIVRGTNTETNGHT